MSPLFTRALTIGSSLIFALSLVSCSQKYLSLPGNFIVLALASTAAHHHGGYVLISRTGVRELKAMPITDRRMKYLYYVSKQGRIIELIGRRERDMGRAPCWIRGVMNSTDESYALSNDGRMIYCIYGLGGGPGPLRSMRIGKPSSLRTSSLKFEDNGPGAIAFQSKTRIVLLLQDGSCITKSPGGFADRLVIFNPENDRIVRKLRCSDAVVRYGSGVALVRRISEGSSTWHYSLNGDMWHDGLYVGATRMGAVLYIDSNQDLRMSNHPGRVLADRVFRAEVFNSGNIDRLKPLLRHRRATDDQIKR